MRRLLLLQANVGHHKAKSNRHCPVCHCLVPQCSSLWICRSLLLRGCVLTMLTLCWPLTEISTARLVEALQLCCLSLSESTRQRMSSFFDFLSHVISNKHVVVSCQISRPWVSSLCSATTELPWLTVWGSRLARCWPCQISTEICKLSTCGSTLAFCIQKNDHHHHHLQVNLD